MQKRKLTTYLNIYCISSLVAAVFSVMLFIFASRVERTVQEDVKEITQKTVVAAIKWSQ